MDDSARGVGRPAGRLRYFILTLLFIATTVNYADRATLSRNSLVARNVLFLIGTQRDSALK